MSAQPANHDLASSHRALLAQTGAQGRFGGSEGLPLVRTLQENAGNARTAAVIARLKAGDVPQDPGHYQSRKPAVQRRENEFASFLDLGVDPRTGLKPGHDEVMDTFVSQVEEALKSWESQRGTPSLRFRRESDIAAAFHVFRKATAADRYHALIWRETARRLEVGMNKAYVREICMFNPTMLIDLRSMLGVEDAKESHVYELQPQWGAEGVVSGWAVKGGNVTKRVAIRYTNTEIPGLGWTQQVSLSGLQLGFGISVDDLIKGRKGKKIEREGALTGPGKWEKASEQPQRQYLEPDFFRGASFTNPSAAAEFNFGAATGKKNLGNTLLITKGMYQLKWDSPAELTVLDEVEAGIPEYGDDVHDGPEFDAGVEAIMESGSTDTIGEADFKAGKWPELRGEPAPESHAWIPLHYARIFFDTGSASLEPGRDFGIRPTATGSRLAMPTIDRMVETIVQWDKKEGYRGSIFKVEISGSHSQKWDRYDDKLMELDRKRELGGELSERELRLEGDLKGLKELENYALALERAKNVEEAFKLKLDFQKHRMTFGVMAKSSVEEATTHEPVGENPYSNFDEDRSVTILVYYQIFNPQSQVNLNAGVPM